MYSVITSTFVELLLLTDMHAVLSMLDSSNAILVMQGLSL
jgi:hypothetical protein